MTKIAIQKPRFTRPALEAIIRTSTRIAEVLDLEARRRKGESQKAISLKIVECSDTVQMCDLCPRRANANATARGTTHSTSRLDELPSDAPLAGSQDRRFPRARMKNSLYINGD